MSTKRNSAKTPASEEKRSDDALVLISARVPESLRRRLRVYAAQHDRTVQGILDEAIDQYLKGRGA
ncbi:hypothetical protein ACH41E_33400 [Streptomyces sp. NPDC020412]|uniref:ribbon-helix-helix protein n=1 Tax=Streptomyces sp. NPDC020412 TaxID=3365073 RepID=UPI0037ADE5C9